jgi:2-polyprenyl-3-methyl-5-hydroxy-6-metoxy-1,4-benzoquinol methylase
LIPLSFRVNHATGMDHSDIIDTCRARFADERVTWLPGQFPEVKPRGLFDRILVYSVIHYLNDLNHVKHFIMEAVSLLRPTGKLLIGDIPNSDRKARFRSSDAGKAFEQKWQKTMAERNEPDIVGAARPRELIALGTLDDAGIMELLRVTRSRGLHSYVMPQPSNLPMGYTREDIVVVRP